MAAKSAATRKAEQRERDKLAEEERLARLLARTIKIDLYHFTDGKLREIMTALDIDEPQDMVTRLIHCAHMMDRETLARLTGLK